MSFQYIKVIYMKDSLYKTKIMSLPDIENVWPYVASSMTGDPSGQPVRRFVC